MSLEPLGGNSLCPDVIYWSDVLCCTVPTNMSDLEVKVTDVEKNYINVFC